MNSSLGLIVLIIVATMFPVVFLQEEIDRQSKKESQSRVKFEIVPKRLIEGESKNWIKLRPVEEIKSHRLKFHLIQNKMAVMKALKEGKQLSKEEVTNLSVIPGVKEAVIEWLDQTPGVYMIGSTEFTITTESTVEVWNKLLKTKFFIWKENVEKEEPRMHWACESVSLPDGKLFDSIVKIDGTTDFPLTSFLKHPVLQKEF